MAEHYVRDAAENILPGQDDPALEKADPFRDRHHVEGLFAEAAFEHFAWSHDLTLSGEKFSLLDEDELTARGYDPNDGTLPLIVKRASDGRCFELEVDVTATEANPVLDPDNPPPMPGQTALF